MNVSMEGGGIAKAYKKKGWKLRGKKVFSVVQIEGESWIAVWQYKWVH